MTFTLNGLLIGFVATLKWLGIILGFLCLALALRWLLGEARTCWTAPEHPTPDMCPCGYRRSLPAACQQCPYYKEDLP